MDATTVAAVAHWMELRATHRPGASRAEDLAAADMLRSGDWEQEAADLQQAAAEHQAVLDQIRQALCSLHAGSPQNPGPEVKWKTK